MLKLQFQKSIHLSLLRVELEEYPSSPSPKSLIRMELRKFSLKSSTLDANEFDISSLICESRLRLPMWDHLVHKLDEIRLFYLKDGLYQIPYFKLSIFSRKTSSSLPNLLVHII